MYLSFRDIGDLPGKLFFSNNQGKNLKVFHFIFSQFSLKMFTSNLSMMECSAVSKNCQKSRKLNKNGESHSDVKKMRVSYSEKYFYRYSLLPITKGTGLRSNKKCNCPETKRPFEIITIKWLQL